MPCPDWKLLDVMLRRCHLLWIAPLFAALCGLAVHLGNGRQEYAVAVIQSPPEPEWIILPGNCADTRVPVQESARYRLLQSSEVLGDAAEDAGLLEAWQTDRETAGSRLRDFVSFDPVPDSFLVEIKVAPIPGADSAKVCQAILDHTFAEEGEAEASKVKEKLAAVQARVKQAEAELATAKDRYSAEARKDGDAAERFDLKHTMAKAEFLAKEGEVEDWTRMAESLEQSLALASQAEESCPVPEWRKGSFKERLRSSGPVILGSLAAGAVAACILACFLERRHSERRKLSIQAAPLL